jgi:multicomponent Na+:H+ antiporter subunit E
MLKDHQKFKNQVIDDHLKSMKYSFTLFIALLASWLLWSGHFEPFILLLGLFSCIFSLWICHRMKIVDEESAPIQLGIRPFTHYAPWLIKEIFKSNIEVTKIVLAPKLKLQRNMIEVGANPKTELGRVILANSITLTPGTVSVGMEKDRILVHALSFEGAEEDLSGDMDRRVCRLEGK